MIPYPIITNITGPKHCIKYSDKYIKKKNVDFLNLINLDRPKLSSLETEISLYNEIFNQSALVSVSDFNGNIIYVNENFCKTSGYTVTELQSKPHNIVRHPDTPPQVFKHMWTTIERGEVWQGELKNKAKDGSDYWVIAIIAPLMKSYGKSVKYISILYDISKQKQIEEELRLEKNKLDNELHENIAYAKHIHSSFLINNKGDDLCQDSFLIYKALKIISGDFYKIERSENKIMIVIGDSTGHGISASYISVSALNILSRVLSFCSNNPGKILKLINKELNRITHFNKEKQLIESADMIICCVDKQLMQLTYASARMKALIVRGDEIILLKKNKTTVGELCNHDFHIENHCIDIEKGDLIYILSDGTTDQIGGSKNKCIGFKKIQSIIKDIREDSMHIQKQKIEEALLMWQGANEQTDDITIYGIKI